MKKTLGLRKLTRHLLATSCLTVAAGTASATLSYNGPFGSSFGTAAPLPVGTTELTDSNPGTTGLDDWAVFSGLEPGGAFSFSVASQEGAGTFNIFDSTDSPLQQFNTVGSGAPGTIPGDGELVVQVSLGNADNPTNYTLDLDAPLAAPDLGTVWSVGVGLAGAFSLRRKRK